MTDSAGPLVALLVLPIRGYQRWISRYTPPSCRYYPCCSSYAITALRRHGALRGSWLTLRRLGRCNPWSDGGVDHVPPAGMRWREQDRWRSQQDQRSERQRVLDGLPDGSAPDGVPGGGLSRERLPSAGSSPSGPPSPQTADHRPEAHSARSSDAPAGAFPVGRSVA
jgi:putative membrane protein insertion efficiency factor